MQKAVFLDRDGTINVEKDYLYKIEDFEFILGVPEAISKLNKLGYIVIVITNQSGVARGYYTEEDVIKLNEYMKNELKKYNAFIDGIYYCPHHLNGCVEKYKVDCSCRKPKLGLYEKAISDFDIDLSNSWCIGDKETDLIPADKLGMKKALVLTGHGKEQDYKKYSYFNNLYEVVEKISKEELI